LFYTTLQYFVERFIIPGFDWVPTSFGQIGLVFLLEELLFLVWNYRG